MVIRGWALIDFFYLQGGRLLRWALGRGWALNRINTVRGTNVGKN